MSKLRSASVTQPNARDGGESLWGRGLLLNGQGTQMKWNRCSTKKRVSVTEDEHVKRTAHKLKTVGKLQSRILMCPDSCFVHSFLIITVNAFLLHKSVPIEKLEKFLTGLNERFTEMTPCILMYTLWIFTFDHSYTTVVIKPPKNVTSNTSHDLKSVYSPFLKTKSVLVSDSHNIWIFQDKWSLWTDY